MTPVQVASVEVFKAWLQTHPHATEYQMKEFAQSKWLAEIVEALLSVTIKR